MSSFDGASLDDLRAMIANADPSGVDAVASKWSAVHEALRQAQEDLLHHTLAATTHWQGAAAAAFSARADELHQSLGNGAAFAFNASSGVSCAADALRTAQAAMPAGTLTLEGIGAAQQATAAGVSATQFDEHQRQQAVAVMRQLEHEYAAAGEMIGTPTQLRTGTDRGVFISNETVNPDCHRTDFSPGPAKFNADALHETNPTIASPARETRANGDSKENTLPSDMILHRRTIGNKTIPSKEAEGPPIATEPNISLEAFHRPRSQEGAAQREPKSTISAASLLGAIGPTSIDQHGSSEPPTEPPHFILAQNSSPHSHDYPPMAFSNKSPEKIGSATWFSGPRDTASEIRTRHSPVQPDSQLPSWPDCRSTLYETASALEGSPTRSGRPKKSRAPYLLEDNSTWMADSSFNPPVIQ